MTALQASPPQQDVRPMDLAGLVCRHQATVWRYVRYLGADRAEADDLTQETFLAVARASFVELGEQQTAGYLRTTARNQLLALRRRQNREICTVQLEAADAVWAAAADGSGGLDDYLTALRGCVDGLDGRARQAIDLHYRVGASRGAIATELAMQPDGVKTLLRRTRDVLRECIERKVRQDEVAP